MGKNAALTDDASVVGDVYFFWATAIFAPNCCIFAIPMWLPQKPKSAARSSKRPMKVFRLPTAMAARRRFAMDGHSDATTDEAGLTARPTYPTTVLAMVLTGGGTKPKLPVRCIGLVSPRAAADGDASGNAKAAKAP